MATRNLNEVIASVPEANSWKLDKEIDFENKNDIGQIIPKHLNRIAESMTDWEIIVADYLGLSDVERRDITDSNQNDPKKQRYI